MKSFTYENPTKIQFGKGVIEHVGKALVSLGATRVLLVYGEGSILRNGVYDVVSASLKTHGITATTHSGVKGNPRLQHVREGITTAMDAKVQAVLAVGGGSVIDEAKAIAAGVCSAVDVWDFFIGKAAPNASLPVVAVLTLPATGSEMNGISVVTNEETDEKSALVCPGLLNPKVSFLDPETTMSLSTAQTAYACTDILSHIMEAYFTTSS